ncbi:MAG: endonuclease/exonuclease/phosphatase family protein, partial [Phycisphaerales bacterium]
MPDTPETTSEPTRLTRIRATVRARTNLLLLAAAAVLIFGLAWPYHPDGPIIIGYVAFMVRTFIFHGGLIILTLGVLGLLAGSRLAPLLALPMLIICFWSEVSLGPAPTSQPTTRVMSINLLGPNRAHDRVIQRIRDEDPDILVLQEYRGHWHDALKPSLASSHPYADVHPRADAFGA